MKAQAPLFAPPFAPPRGERCRRRARIRPRRRLAPGRWEAERAEKRRAIREPRGAAFSKGKAPRWLVPARKTVGVQCGRHPSILVAHLSRSRELGHRGLKPAQGSTWRPSPRTSTRSLARHGHARGELIDDGVRILDIDVCAKGGRSASFGPPQLLLRGGVPRLEGGLEAILVHVGVHMTNEGHVDRLVGGQALEYAMHGRPPRRRSKRPGNDTATMTVPRRRECPSTVGSAREGRSCTRRAESKRPARRPRGLGVAGV